jgi:hypothetical protein
MPAAVDRSRGPIKLRPGFKEIQGRADFSSARSLAGRLVVFPSQPQAKPRAADGPRLSMPLDHDANAVSSTA